MSDERQRSPDEGTETGDARPSEAGSGEDAGRAADEFRRLVEVVAALRAPGGCPWDREQTHESLTPYVVEEAHEVVDAIRSGDADALRGELGDLLLQVVLHAQVATDDGGFTAADVCRALTEKLVRRHPHVFADEAPADSAADVRGRWEKLKEQEREELGEERGVLDGVPRGLPALLKAQRLTEKAGGVGFDWPDARSVTDKLREELAELLAEVERGDQRRAADEFGDLLFVLANLARHLGIDAEAALQGTNARFVRRFEGIEARLRAQGRRVTSASLEEMDRLWNEAKAEERGGGGAHEDR